MTRNIVIPIGIILIFFFYGFYLFNAFQLYKTGIFAKYDVLFGADVPRVIEDMTTFEADHWRTGLHPLFVLLVNPLGSICVKILSKPNTSVAIGINSFFGSLGIALAFIYFWIQSRGLIYSLLLSILFGFSMSQMFWSSVPETYTLGVITLLLNYILFAIDYNKEVIHKRLWILIGFFTIAIATTNFIQTIILFTLLLMKSSFKNEECSTIILTITRFASKIIMITIVLAVIQKQIYPSSWLFFDLETIKFELKSNWFSCFWLKDSFTTISQILKHFCMVNLFAQIPNTHNIEGKGISITFSGPLNYSWIGWSGIILWGILLINGSIVGIKGIFSRSNYFYFYIAIGLCLLFEALLYSCYGWYEDGHTELFLFTPYFTFLTFIVASWSFKNINCFPKILLIILCILAIVNNNLIFQHIINIIDNLNS